MVRRLTFCLTLASFLLASFAIASDEKQIGNLINPGQKTTQKSSNDYETHAEPGGSSIQSGDCSDYIDISPLPLPISVSGTTEGATNDYAPYPEMPACWQGEWYPSCGMGPDVTYKWTVPADTVYVITLRYSTYDTGLEIYNFTCPTEPVYPDDFICGSDDMGGSIQSQLVLRLPAGLQMLIVVDGHADSAGPLRLEIFVASMPVQLSCPMNTAYGQSPSTPRDPFNAWTSDLNCPELWVIYDNLPSGGFQVCGIEFYGFDAYCPDTWSECVEDPADFEVRFYEEGESGHPGNIIWSGIITPDRIPSGIIYADLFELNLYRGELDTCLTVSGGWVSVQGVSYGGDPHDCLFLWLDSQEGDDTCWLYGFNNWHLLNTSMSLCLLDSTATAVYENPPDIPTLFGISQNHPNPFNAQTTIQYSLPSQSLVTIDIFDLLGRKIETLAKGIRPAGNHQVIWDASGQQSGIYFYKMRAGDYSKTKRMTLLK